MRRVALSALLLTSCGSSTVVVAAPPSHRPHRDPAVLPAFTPAAVSVTTTSRPQRASRSGVERRELFLVAAQGRVPVAVRTPASSTPAPPDFVALRRCESGGDYASRGNPLYRGAYQFDRRTWVSVGGTGDPADAAPAEQDMGAALLFAARGRQPWPRCGRFL